MSATDSISYSGFGGVKMTQAQPHSKDKVNPESFKSSPATGPNTFLKYIHSSSCRYCAFRELGNISSGENKQSSSNSLELSCKSSPCPVLLSSGEETPGCVKQMGFCTSWLLLAPGNTWQTEKQLRHNSL